MRAPRLQVFRLPVLIAATLVAVTAAGSAGVPAAGAPGAGPPARSGESCTDGGQRGRLEPTGAHPNEQFTRAFREFGNSGGGWSNRGGWAASDGVYSVELGDRVFWLMNDTFLGPVNDDESMTEPGFIHGSVVTGGQDGLPDTTITGGTRSEPESIASPPDAVDGDPWYWNVDGVVDGGKLRVLQARTGSTDADPPWNFGWVGTDIVTYSRDFTVESVQRTYGTPGGVNWGNELLRCRGHVYIYGQRDGDAYLARVRAGQLTEADWEFSTGDGWSAEETEAEPVARDVGASYSVTPMAGRFVLTTTSQAIFVDHTVYVATAATPAGPFTGRTGVYTAPEGGVGDLYAPYNVAAHPAISDPGELVVSYNVNSGVGDDILADANNNRPRFVTVEFASKPAPAR